MKRWIAIVAFLALASVAIPACAEEGDVAVGGVMILRIRFPAGGMTVQQRADAITGRVNKIIAQESIKPEDVKVRPAGNEAVLLVGNELLITVDRTTANFNRATPRQLGEMWAVHLRQVLPQLTPGKDAQQGL